MHFLAFLQTAAPENYQWLASLGVGGALAGGMFLAYRQDRQRSEDRLLEITRDFRSIIQDNTKAMTTLVDVIRNYRS